jgi:hypothetical protein
MYCVVKVAADCPRGCMAGSPENLLPRMLSEVSSPSQQVRGATERPGVWHKPRLNPSSALHQKAKAVCGDEAARPGLRVTVLRHLGQPRLSPVRFLSFLLLPPPLLTELVRRTERFLSHLSLCQVLLGNPQPCRPRRLPSNTPLTVVRQSPRTTPLSPESPGPTNPFNPPQSHGAPRQRALSQGQDASFPSTRSASTSFASSPLNPNNRSRPSSSLSVFNRLASEDAATLSNTQPGQRGSMILYRLAAVDDMGALLPPRNTWHN